MKTRYKTLTGLLLIVQLVCAQNTVDNDFSFLGTSFDDSWKVNSFKIETDALVGSNSINTQMFSDVLFGSTFTPSAKATFLDLQSNKVNTYGFVRTRAEYKVSKTVAIYLKQTEQLGFSVDKNFGSLLVWGNSPFKGEEVSSPSLSYLNASTLSIGASLNHLSSEKWKIKGSYGINVLNHLSQVSANTLSIYTSPNGDYIDVEASNLSLSQEGKGIVGVGFDADFEVRYFIDSVNTISIKALDFNFNFLINQDYLYVDTSLRYTGYTYKVLENRGSILDETDSTIRSELEKGTKRKNYLVLPSRLQLAWMHKMDEANDLALRVESISIGNLAVYGEVRYGHQFSKNLKLVSSLGFGNFTGLLWSEDLEFKAKEKYSLFISLRNMNSLLMAEKVKSYGFALGAALNI